MSVVVTRRQLFAAGMLPMIGGKALARQNHPPRIVEGPVIETAAGRLRGVTVDGVMQFRGIPYAASPVGQTRFALPAPVMPWASVRGAIGHGPVCPAMEEARDGSASVFSYMMPRGDPGVPDEDCLRLNLWAPRNVRQPLPVMVWLHAGGFERGYAHEYVAADGMRLAGQHDVVVVSVNHRLGPLGFLALDDAPDAANAGMHDIVAALRWVRENVSQFGGDPERVTLFGQSGGAYKIGVLLAMPAAGGLFHRAILQSGVRHNVHTPENAARLGHMLCRVVDVPKGTAGLERLRALPAAELLRAAQAAAARLRHQFPASFQWQTPAWRYEPTAGRVDLPDHPADPAALARAARIPLICGTTRNEIAAPANQADIEAIDWTGLATILRPELGERTERLVAAARKTDSRWSPADVLTVLQTREFRLAAFDYCRAATAAGNGAVYNYIFDWRTPLFAGRPRAFHASDVAFAFDQTDLAWRQTGGGPGPRRLASFMSGCWASFARSGDPGGGWRRFDSAGQTAMIFDNESAARARPDAPLIAALAA
jgi:para-nitrobenzyl esterase